jgi:BlaI family transcriptional regulator, penicillinase repressor
MRWFGAKQLEILRVLWRRGRATAREITDDLNAGLSASASPVAHSTVQTLLRELEGKSAVAHDAEDRTFVFYALVAESEIRDSALGDLIQAVFQGSAQSLVTHLLGRERLAPEEIQRLRGMLDEMEKKQ